MPTYFILDEFANIGRVPDFDKKISTSRSRKISFSVILQNLDQLEAVYEKSYETIIGNCDTHVFLGSNSQKTVEYFSKALGEKTISKDQLSKNRDKHNFWTQGYNASEQIMARALKIMFDEGLTKMTIGSNALSIYKEMNQRFDTYFPVLPAEVDKDIRRSYKGGFTYLNPLYKEKEVGYGNIYDVNSLYPSVMYYENMPIGNPEFFKGEYQYDPLYPLYIVTLSCSFKLKKGKIPTIQLKRNLHYLPTEYIETTNGDIETFTLTNIDLELFLSHYDVEDLMYHSGWKFKATKGLFCSYIDMYTNLKINSKKEGNGALYLIAKLMLNSLYGKFGLNPEMRSKYPYLKEDGSIGYHLTDKQLRDSVYIPVATFITSYARRKTITTSQKIRDYSLKTYGEDYYIYSDTDSIHCRNLDAKELEGIIDIDKYKLGAWDNEAQFTRGKYIRQKCYIEHILGKDKINVTIAGFPKNLGEKVTFDNFNPDFSSNGKLAFKHVKGGIVLVDTTFTIKR